MVKLICFTILLRNFAVIAYSNQLFALIKWNRNVDADMCLNTKENQEQVLNQESSEVASSWQNNFMSENYEVENDPYEVLNNVVYKYLFGNEYSVKGTNDIRTGCNKKNFLHFPTGRALRKAELFNGKSGVHLPRTELMHFGYCLLNVTDDYMQTAVDAFAVFTNGDIADILRLPAEYVLNSARTISMMMISHERLAATWNVVRGDRDPVYVSYETLEKYRPLFKYLNGKDMARLNLTDQRILNYVGTHPDLNRHQVGLVASKYIRMNRYWSEPKYLNLMNNLLCGVPINFMRDIQENVYLQLSHQVFYHTRACDPIQRRFFLAVMTRTQALGKSYSWNAQDVSRLGLLLADVEGPDLSSIKPEALAGLTAQVMMAMRPENLLHLTEVQLRYIEGKPYNIFCKKLKMLKDQYNISVGVNQKPVKCVVLLSTISTALSFVYFILNE